MHATRSPDASLCSDSGIHPARMGEDPRVSGAVLLDRLGVMRERTGPERMEAAIRSLPDPVRGEIEGMPVSWCCVEAVNAVLEAAAPESGRSPSSFQAEVVRMGVERTFETLWRIILRFTSDEALVRRTPLI